MHKLYIHTDFYKNPIWWQNIIHLFSAAEMPTNSDLIACLRSNNISLIFDMIEERYYLEYENEGDLSAFILKFC